MMRAWRLGVLCGVAAWNVGCASGGGRVDGIASLRAMAQREAATHPKPMIVPPPPTLADALSPGQESDEARQYAHRSLQEVVEIVRGMAPDPPRSVVAPVTEEDRLIALRLYVQGRERLIAGAAGEAAIALRQAVRLDPGSGEAWVALADAEFSLGSRAEAVANLRRGIALGVESARAREMLGRDAIARGRPDEAAGEFARAWTLLDAGSDPALKHLLGVQLGQSLAVLGAYSAAREAMLRGIELPELFTQSTTYRADIAALYRRRPEVLRMVGDLSCRLGEFDVALEAYRRAGSLAESVGDALLGREAYVLVRLGRPTEAAEEVLSVIKDSDGWIDDGVLDVIGWLSRHGGVGDALADALGTLSRRMTAPTPTMLSRMAQARAACVGPAKARSVLVEHLRRDPGDADVMALLITSSRGESVRVLVQSLSSAASGSPTAPRDVAQAMLMSGRDFDAMLGALGRSDAEAALRAHLLADLGRDADAMTALRSLAGRRSLLSQAARARVGATMGAWDEAVAALDQIERTPPSVDRELARCAALLALQRFDEAVGAISATADDPNLSRDAVTASIVLRMASEAAAMARSRTHAERWARRAVVLDPKNEAAHARLLAALTMAPTQDSSAIDEALRAIRLAAPNGRLPRIIQAREMLTRGLGAQAEHVLDDAADRHPHDLIVLELLATAWITQIEGGSTDASSRAEAWLRRSLEARPTSPAIVSMLARILAASNRAEEADALLAVAIERSPIPELVRLRERVLRDALGSPDEALALARARVGGLRRGIEETIESTDVHIRGGDLPSAAETLRNQLPDGVSLTQEQQSVLGLVLLRAAGEAGADAASADLPAVRADENRRQALSDLLDTALSRRVSLPPTLHATRVIVRAAEPATDVEPLAEAVFDAIEAHPSLTMEIVRGAASILHGFRETRRLLDLFERIAPRYATTPIMLAWLHATAQWGGAADGRALVQTAREHGLTLEILQELQPQHVPLGEAQAAGELAFSIANEFAFGGRENDGAAMYRFALSLDAEHGWAANNLGYHLVDQDEPTAADIAEADELLTRALRLLPNESSVLDSVGWLRYKQGVIHSKFDAEGNLVVEGALPLLERAAELGGGPQNPTILDHLGDAKWVGGDSSAAIQAWERAAQAAARRLARLVREQRPSSETSAVTQQLVEIRAKISAARSGQSPDVATHAAVNGQ